MKTKRFFCVCITLCMIMTILSVGMLTAFAADALTVTIDTGASVILKDADGDGYYDIGTADELYAFAAAVNGGNTTINGELTANITVNENVLTEDVELNGDGSNFRVWTPIGNSSNRYIGIFDGSECAVSGLYFKNSVKNVGLFGYVEESGKVQNVGVKDFYFESGDYYVGGIVGYNRGTVTNCYNAGTVKGTYCTGGVVGYNTGTVTNCYNAGMVKGNYDFGGVICENRGTVTNCFNIIALSSQNYNDRIGGIVAENYGTVTNCYNTGNIVKKTFCGGVVGENWSGTITNCYYLTGNAKAGIGYDVTSNEQVISEVTEAQVKAASGEDGALVDMLNVWVAQQNDVNYKGWHFCSSVSADYPSLNLAYTYSNNGDNHIAKCTLCGFETTEAHTYFYTTNESIINESCKLCEHSDFINFMIPENTVYDGNAHVASYTGSFTNPDTTVLIQYLRYVEDSETGYEVMDSTPVDAGNYIIRFSVGETYTESFLTIAPKEISLIGVEVNYKDYDGTPYVEIDPYYGNNGFKIDGIVDYDNVEILCTSAELESAKAGTYDEVTVKGLSITGEDAHNYTIVSEATIPIYNVWGNYESSVTVYEKNLSINLLDQEAGSLDAIDQSKWEIDEYYGLLEGHRIDSLKLIAEMNEGSTKYGVISVEEGSVKIVDADGNDVTANYYVSAYSATLTLTCPDHDEFEQGFCTNCGGYKKASYNETEGYYEIENAGQLFWFAEYVANVTNEANAKLTDNITIPEGKEWTPIYNLYGTFDGNYKTISGLNVSESDSDYIGFLGYIGNYANVCNLHITNSSFIDTDATYGGAIVGYHGGGEITNCYVDETVNVETGGISGALAGYTAYTTMKNCYAHGVLAGNGYYGTFENCYYIGEDDELDGTTAVTAEQLASGEVAYLLGNAWGQELGVEAYPTLGGEKVYFEDGIYYNDVITLGTDNGDGTYSLPEGVVGYYIDDTFVDAGKYPVTDGAVITTVYFNVTMVNGAQVRFGDGLDESGKIKSGNGLRFLAQVDRSGFDGIGYGMRITTEGSSSYIEVDAEKWQDDTTFTVALTNMAEGNYIRKFTATPFVTVKYDNGTEKTVYGKDSVTRSIYQVASGLLKDETQTATSLINVLNAYANQTGIRLVVKGGELMANTNYTESGSYKLTEDELHFEVSDAQYDQSGNKYSVILTALGNAEIITDNDYWYDYIRINNNNSLIKDKVTVERVEGNSKAVKVTFAAEGLIERPSDSNDNTIPDNAGGDFDGESEYN